MQLDITVDKNTPEYPLGGVPDFHFLNLEDEDEANTNLEEKNPDANTEAFLFGDADTTCKDEEGPAEDRLANK